MRIGFPVIFIRDGVEYAGIVASSSAKEERPPTDPNVETLTQAQQLGELRCSIAFWDTSIRGWRQADDVPYLSIELPIPGIGDYYSEVGAPDAEERAAAAVDRAARQALFDGARLTDEERAAIAAAGPGELVPIGDDRRSPDLVDTPATSAELSLEESINEGLEQEARDRVEARMDAEEAPAAAVNS